MTIRMTAPLLVLGAMVLNTSAIGQTFHKIDCPPGSSGLSALAGSVDGSAISGYYGFFGGPSGGYRWTVSGGVQVIPNLSNLGYTYANGLSRDGQVVAGISNDLGFWWTPSGGVVAIGPFAGGTPTRVYGVSGNGLVFFGSTRQPSGAMRAFKWTQSGGLTLMNPLPGGYNSDIFATVPNGSIAIGHCDISGINRPLIWNAAGVPTDLTISWPQANYAMAIDDTGSTIFGRTVFGGGGSHALRWRLINNNWVADDLGVLTGWTNSNVDVTGTVADGSAHVGNHSNGSGTAPHLWTTDLGFKPLSTWLPSVGFNTTGYQIVWAKGLSADGTAIWGEANYAGQRVGWVARGVPCLHVPSVYQDPTDLVTACQGGSFTLSVSGGGAFTGTLSYRWYKDSAVIANGPRPGGATASGATSDTLTISGSTANETGYYWCEIYNPCGSVLTSATEVNFQPNPSFTQSPAPASVCDGGSVNFFGGVNNASWIQWEYFNGAGWAAFPNGSFFDFNNGIFATASGANTPTLSLSGVYLGSVSHLPVRISAGNDCRTLRPIETTLSHAYAPLLLANPTDTTWCRTVPALFSVNLFSSTPATYQWQLLDQFTNSWLYLSDGFYTDGLTGLSGTVAGSQTPTLSFTMQTFGITPPQQKFRCIMSNDCSTIISSPANLNICPADFNCDGFVDGFDYDDFVTCFETNTCPPPTSGASTDFNGDGFVDGFDYDDFVASFEFGC